MSKTCPDCGANPGSRHRLNCDVERCYLCGRQAFSCGCNCNKRTKWTGEWPGVKEAEELGLYSVCIPGKGWVPCTKDTPGASADLNTLFSEGKWDKKTQKWVMPAGVKLV